jgi:hypothetical protein
MVLLCSIQVTLPPWGELPYCIVCSIQVTLPPWGELLYCIPPFNYRSDSRYCGTATLFLTHDLYDQRKRAGEHREAVCANQRATSME